MSLQRLQEGRVCLSRILLYGMILSLIGIAQGLPAFGQDQETAAERLLERRQKTELMGFFLKNPDQAQLPQTPIAIELYNQAAGHFQRQDYDLARETLKDALRYDERNSFAYELLADIDYLESRLEKAKKNYRKAYVLRPSEDLRKKIEKLGREFQTEKDFKTYRDEKFILKHDGTLSEEAFTRIRTVLAETYKTISQDFGYYFKQPAIVLLYGAEDFRKITELPHWVSGVYDGKIRMPQSPAGLLGQDIRALAAHEMTHAFVAGMSGGDAPAWINEGLAEYQENKVKEQDLIVFRAAVKTKTLLSLDQLMNEEKLAEETDPLFANLFYVQSFRIVSYLVDRFGMFRIKQLLMEFAKGKDSNEAIWHVFKVSPEQLEKEWKATITN